MQDVFFFKNCLIQTSIRFSNMLLFESGDSAPKDSERLTALLAILIRSSGSSGWVVCV